MSAVPYIDAAEMQRAVTMTEMIDCMAQAFAHLSNGQADAPTRTNQRHPGGELLLMPAVSPAGISVKCVTITPDNPARNLPLIHAAVLLFDGETGQPRAILDGEYLTALRTGAASGLATRLCAKPRAKTLALFGIGAQAPHQIAAVTAVRPIQHIHIYYHREPERAQAFIAQVRRDHPKASVELITDPARLKEADVICTATPATTPLFNAHHISPGCHINAVGAYRPDMIEIPTDLTAKAHILVDQRQSCLREAGDILHAMETGKLNQTDSITELGAVITNPILARPNPEAITLFKSVGNAVQDLYAARLIMDKQTP